MPKRPLPVTSIDELFYDESAPKSNNSEFSSTQCVSQFKSGEDDNSFNKTIANLTDVQAEFHLNCDEDIFGSISTQPIASTSKVSTSEVSNHLIEQFKEGNDDAKFSANITTSKLIPFNTPNVRERCRIQARKFKFDEILFDRIPMWVFRHCTSRDPICDKIEILLIFIMINKISPAMITSFYIEGGH